MIVFDSSTLILLVRGDLLVGFLNAVKQKIVIPKEVERECCEEKESVDAMIIRQAIQEKKIEVRPLRERRAYEKIRVDFNLGRGEAEAVALGLAGKAKLVATDDKRAIHACSLLKIPYTTAIDILVRLYEKGVLEKQEALVKLESLERYGRYKKAIIADARSKVEVR